MSISPLRPPGDPRNPFETIAPRRGTALHAVFALHPKGSPAGELSNEVRLRG